MKGEYRFVVCVDVEGDSLSDAYANLLRRMNGNDWESTDEVYSPDDDSETGDELISREKLLAARMEVLALHLSKEESP